MVLPHYYLIALVSPFGRLGQFHFAVLACVLGFAHLYIYAQMTYMPQGEPWNIYTIALFGMLWMKFCILSRRLHDTGSNGLIAVPVLIIAAIVYLCLVDPNLAGPKELRGMLGDFIVDQGMRIPRALFIAVFIYCIRAPSETGPNAYGPEFGDTDDNSAAAGALDKVQAANGPNHTFKRFNSDKDTGWAERRRPKGFGRR